MGVLNRGNARRWISVFFFPVFILVGRQEERLSEYSWIWHAWVNTLLVSAAPGLWLCLSFPLSKAKEERISLSTLVFWSGRKTLALRVWLSQALQYSTELSLMSFEARQSMESSITASIAYSLNVSEKICPLPKPHCPHLQNYSNIPIS